MCSNHLLRRNNKLTIGGRNNCQRHAARGRPLRQSSQGPMALLD